MLLNHKDGFYSLDSMWTTDEDCDYVEFSSVASQDMFYIDVANADGKNHISELAPGQSVTVHMAYVVNEPDLAEMYFSFDSLGDLSSDSIRQGVVDIRQKK